MYSMLAWPALAVDPAGPMVDEAGRAAPNGAKDRPTDRRVPSEREIDSPDKKTLILLFVLFIVTTCSWGAARFACNMHPPESHAAPKLPIERLTLTPKDASIEFIQRLRSYDFDGALGIAEGPLVAEVERAKSECAAHANDCARNREAAAGRLTTAVVVATDGFNAGVRVRTMLKGTTERYRLRMHREDSGWKAVSYDVESSPTAAPASSSP